MPQFVPSEPVDGEKPQPEMILFEWALVMNRIEIAELFWRRGQVNKHKSKSQFKTTIFDFFLLYL